MPMHPYLPHILSGLALLSVSMNFSHAKKAMEEERSKIDAQLSILESINESFTSGKPMSSEEVERLRKLARPGSLDSNSTTPASDVPKDDKEHQPRGILSVFRSPGQKTPVEDNLSQWDQRDLERLKRDIAESENTSSR